MHRPKVPSSLMPEDPDPAAGGGGTPDPEPADPPKTKTITELLAGLDEDSRKVIEGEVTKARNEAKGLRERLKAAEPKATKLDELLAAQQSDADKQTAALEAATARADASVARAVKAEVRALAAGSFADPDDAPAFLNLTGYVDAAGEVDTDAIKSDLADLLTRKPHLGKPAKPGMAPDTSQGKGTREGGESPHIAILRAQIAEATSSGNAVKLLALNSQLARALQLQAAAAPTS